MRPGFKHLVAFKAYASTHKVNGDVAVIMDLDDLLRITDEGKAGYVTTWVNLTAGLGGISTPSSFPGGIYFFKHDMRGDADEVPRFKATFQRCRALLV